MITSTREIASPVAVPTMAMLWPTLSCAPDSGEVILISGGCGAPPGHAVSSNAPANPKAKCFIHCHALRSLILFISP
jgi:hypothetical protein